MRKLRAGEEIDVRAEAPPGPPAEDETGQVAEALGTVHRAALRAAVERAELASGISGVFVNLARRSQVLVHRQLSLLDSMERRSEDPNELSDLFRLDHLTTRMRRHAESLIILSGAAPGRAWRMPVSLTNVVRAAVSEVEDYARVEVRQLPEASVVGAAVADLTHLLAEIVENAAQFSPPHTRVRITGEPVGNGYVVEVEDRGSAWARRRSPRPTGASSSPRRSTCSTATGSDCSWSAGSRPGTASRCTCGPRPTAVPPRSFCSPRPCCTAVRRNVPPQDRHHRKAAHGTGVRARVRRPGTGIRAGRHRAARTGAPGAERRRSPRERLVGHPTAWSHHTAAAPSSGRLRRLRRPSTAGTTGESRPPTARTALREAGGNAASRRRRRAHPELVRDRMAAYRDGWVRGSGRSPGLRATPDPEAGSDSSEGDPA